MIRTGPDPLTLPLIELASQGQRPRCSDPGDRRLWLSDDPDERASAAARCRGCQVLTACQQSADIHGEQFGVWAGVDRTKKPTQSTTNRKKKRP